MWKLVYTSQAKKDAKKLGTRIQLKKKAQLLLEIIAKDPLTPNPPFEKLVGDLDGAYSRRINIQHRLVYQILKKEKVVKVIRLYSHYE